MRSVATLIILMGGCSAAVREQPPPAVSVEASGDAAAPEVEDDGEDDGAVAARSSEPGVPYWVAAPTHEGEERVAKNASRADKEAAKRAYREAIMRLDRGEHEAALQFLIQAHKLVPGAAPMFKIAECLDALGRAGDAIDAYAWFIGARPSERYADKVRQAEERLAALAAAAPVSGGASAVTSARAEFQAGVAAYTQGDYRSARDHFVAAYGLSPNASVLYNIAMCHEKLGDVAAACASYSDYLRQKPGSTARSPSLDQACASTSSP